MAEKKYQLLRVFPTQSTNIFPIANSKLGGQLLTEFNLKSRESVATDSSVKYVIGQSFVHSLEDFQISPIVGSTMIQIAPGRGVIDGHFIELLTPITIDMTEVNANRSEALSGTLFVGLRILYSTSATMMGSIQVEGTLEGDDDTGVYNGIQVVIGPRSALKTPSDTPTNKSAVTVHLILGSFNYNHGNGYLEPDSVENSTDKIKNIDASRLFNLEEALVNKYVTKPTTGDPSGLYGFASRRTSETDPAPVFGLERLDNCLFEWRNMNTDLPEEGLVDTDPAGEDRERGRAGAKFVANEAEMYLDVPAKQGYVVVDGVQKFRRNLKVPLPEADYVSGTYGVVGPLYTKNIKEINSRLNGIYTSIKGKQRGYVDVLVDREDLPVITNMFRVGDYILVREDQTPSGVISFEGTGYPSTLYPVLPGVVKSATYLCVNKVTDGVNIVDVIDGTCIGTVVSSLQKAPFILDNTDNRLKKFEGEFDEEGHPVYDSNNNITESDIYEFLGLGNSEFRGEPMISEDLRDEEAIDSAKQAQDNARAAVIGAYITYTMKYAAYVSNPTAAKKQAMESARSAFYDAKRVLYEATTQYYSLLGIKDYFIYRIEDTNEDTGVTTSTEYIFAVQEAGPYAYGGPIWISGPTYPATEESVGGFLSIDPTVLGKGYVHIDDENHLVLNDFSMLMGDILALQLAQGVAIPSGLSADVVQSELDNYVNNRVAFPNYEVLNQIISSSAIDKDGGIPSYKIEIHLSLPHADAGQDVTINLHNVDSRFGTYIHLYIEGDADSHTTLNISDCEKIRIDSNISGTPTINLNNCCLYYDYSVLDKINWIYGLSLWYERFSASDPRIHVDGMTVCSDVKVRSDSDENVGRKYNNDTGSVEADDLYYGYNVESITFSRYGEIIGAGINIVNSTTTNLLGTRTDPDEGFLYKEFVLPQNNTDLQYPVSKVKNVIRIDGSFTTIYKPAQTSKHICIDTIFSASITMANKLKQVAAGRIGIHYVIKYIDSYSGVDTLVYTQLTDDQIFANGGSDLTTLYPGQGTRSYHTFRGISGNNISS